MKLSVYDGLETNKRSMTLWRIAIIGGAHVLIIGGIYLVTQFGSDGDGGNTAMAGAVTWSSQSADAQKPSVDAASNSVFDQRAGNLAGYNDGDASPTLLASASQTDPSKGRYAPRRPSGSGSNATPSTGSSAPSRANDSVLKPINNNSDSVLYPARTPSRPDEGLSQTIEYKVQNGDSLWGISKRFSVTVPEITAANPGIKANAIRVGQTIQIPRTSSSSSFASTPSSPSPTPSKPVSGQVYTVKSGDVLSRIASRQGVTVSELKAANGLSSDMIRVGQELIIPTRRDSSKLVSQQHRGPKVTVEAGDTLDKIAAVHGVSVTELMKLNDIENPRLIRIGQVILIPESSGAAAPAPRRQTVNTPPQRQPAQQTPPQRQPTRSLDSLEVEEPAGQDLPSLDSFGDSFSEEDLEEQPLIPIQE
ncbi:LysM peptidoglycan-binding domain-containing protein [Pelagicoccus sp. SDUM812003]|uniref:muramidase family protein n=1 Tax=Pelagicoccus sp. SDUM812003 TaxID=3041267 RepID=UPI00280CAD4A|nr:LysM peptidoglycan-binding domain-containing protein [Pelagicoccus sp. SDUM812003]MDQ8204411.1 LysM peptidoglycan-binding domain-containing protein [Pelagicoccus sp. SDUM812003]